MIPVFRLMKKKIKIKAKSKKKNRNLWIHHLMVLVLYNKIVRLNTKMDIIERMMRDVEAEGMNRKKNLTGNFIWLSVKSFKTN